MEPDDFGPLTGAAGLGEKLFDLPAFFGGTVAKEMDQHQGSFPLEKVAANLFAVARVSSGQVQDIVLNLEGRAEVPAEFTESLGLQFSSFSDKGANAQRIDEGVPGGLLETHVKV